MSEPLEELSEEGLLAANRYQRRIVGDGDEQALARFLHPNFIINGPHNICGEREQIFRLSDAALEQENRQTQIEKTSLTGNVGIVMGNEVVTPTDESLLAGLVWHSRFGGASRTSMSSKTANGCSSRDKHRWSERQIGSAVSLMSAFHPFRPQPTQSGH